MLGARATGELARGSRGTTGSALRITAGAVAGAAPRAACGAAIEDGSAALNARPGGLVAGAGSNSRGLHDGRFVDGTGSGLGHDHAANGWCGRRGCLVLRGRRDCGCRLRCDGVDWSGDRCFVDDFFVFDDRSSGNGNRLGGGGRDRDYRRGCDGHILGSGSDGGGRSDGVGWSRFGCGRPVDDAGMVFTNPSRRRRRDSRFGDDDNGRRDDNCRTRGDDCASRGFGDDSAGRRAGGDGRRSRRRNHNGRRGTRLRHDFARLRTGRNCGCCSDGSRRSCRLGRCGGRWRLGADGRVRLPRLGFSFLLFGENGFEHVAGLGDVREIDFRLDALLATRRRAGAPARLRGALELGADLVRLVVFQRTGVGLAGSQAELRQYVENLPTLDFHLACEIVDSNLTHPPLFRMCCRKPFSRA